jgi:hypothetical protein
MIAALKGRQVEMLCEEVRVQLHASTISIVGIVACPHRGKMVVAGWLAEEIEFEPIS